MEPLYFASDYQEGACQEILTRLIETNFEKTSGYGTDPYSESARKYIRKACDCPNAGVHFLVGGTQTNATVIDAMLPSYQGVIAADTGHIAIHEAGAIEFGGHKVLSLPHDCGKLNAAQIDAYCEKFYNDESHEHMVMPGMVYISQPTEYGTLYTRKELTEIRKVCDQYKLHLFADGARLAYALAAPGNDVSLKDLAALCDVFYIGGTKCGMLFGEAVVVPNPALLPHFFTITKQHGALLAKGRILGIQFETMFKDTLYEKVGQHAITAAEEMRTLFRNAGYQFAFDSPTNQTFLLLTDKEYHQLSSQIVCSFWEKPDAGHTIVRLATSWATAKEELQTLAKILQSFPKVSATTL